jgi:dihydropteroate synthase
MRTPYRWQLRSRTLELGERTLIMGVVNVTPDSFSDGGQYLDPQRAVEGALRMVEEGADIVDIGGESTRPGTRVLNAERGEQPAVSQEEELRRLVPVLQGVLRARGDTMIAVDTYKAGVARVVVGEGAEIVNDVSGFQWDPLMAETCGELKCGVVVMHTRGRPAEWLTLAREADIVSAVEHALAERLRVALEHGVERRRIVVDPGFGFGKDFEENYALLAHFDRLHRAGFPLLAGTSRKGFIGRAVGQRVGRDTAPDQRLFGSLAAMVTCILKGAHVVRVHDVKATVEAAAVADEVLRVERQH